MSASRTITSRRLRRSMGRTEVRLWAGLKARQVDGWKFRRQHPIGPYFVDFYCPAARLIVEVDGPAHDDDNHGDRDRLRDVWLDRQGYRVVRIPVRDIDEDMTEVLERIFMELSAPPSPSATPPHFVGRTTNPRFVGKTSDL
ncbi:MAG TPA: endonuclease domain-containing protein [Candidatus Dormibacteraeota bacterium]|nr:endonuclease domain-containing protein [Candidatus Dormibacteraeota bacterium]